MTALVNNKDSASGDFQECVDNKDVSFRAKQFSGEGEGRKAANLWKKLCQRALKLRLREGLNIPTTRTPDASLLQVQVKNTGCGRPVLYTMWVHTIAAIHCP